MSKQKLSSDRDKVDIENTLFYGLQLDEYQEAFKQAIFDKDLICVAVEAQAGTGKTQISVAAGSLLVEAGRYEKLIYVTFPCCEEKQGLLPGSIQEKSEPYFEPLREALIKCNYNPDQVFVTNTDAVKQGKAFVVPLTHTYLRGVNFENAVVILEEVQNGYLDEIRKILTRCHDSCKVIMIGNHKQCDIIKNKHNAGFARYLDYMEGQPWFKRCELKKNYRGVFANFCDNIE